MKKVIFVCLLSLSVCLGQANTPTGTAAQTPVSPQTPNATEAKTPDAKPEHTEAPSAITTKPAEAPKEPSNNNTTTAATNGTHATNETSTKNNETKPAGQTNSTETKATNTTEVPVKPEDAAKDKKETKPTVPPAPASNATSADSKDNKKNETTTPKGDNVSPTVVPIQAKSRAFDGPSFIGGIILTLGLLAIGFMGFKYYKNQTERNYHTL